MAAALANGTATAQENLYREAVSREFTLHVETGTDSTQAVSREISLHIENGTPESEVVSREYVLSNADSAPPPPVAPITVNVSPTGDAVTLDWFAYNPWQFRDIGGFRIYVSDAGPILDVSGLTPVATTDGETTSITLDGLTPFQDHYVAVVAVDSQGNADPAVQYAAAYVISPEIISREVSLFVGQESEPSDRSVISREYDLAIAPAAPPPALTEFSVSVSPLGDVATLAWPDYNPFLGGPVAEFRIFLSDDGPIGKVTGLTPFAIAPGGATSITLDGLAPNTDHYFAVVPVDPLGNFIAEVNYGAGYVLSPEVLSRELSLYVGQESTPLFREVVSREFDLVVPDAAVPPPVTGAGSGFFVETSTDAFGAVVLDFTSYNAPAVPDIVGYDVYVAGAFFDNVAGLTPFARLPGGSQRQTLGGLSGGSIQHFAVVAVDALGGFDPAVRSFSAQASISGVGEVESLAGTSTSTTLAFTWSPPENASAFLQAYRIRFGSADPVDLPLAETSFTATDLTPGTGYPIRVATIDVFGNESPGTSLNAATWLPNPPNLRLTLRNGQVVALWDPPQPSALVAFYRVYRESTGFSETTGLTPLSTVLATEFVLGDLATVQNQWIAVTAANPLGASDPAVTAIQATKQGQTITFPPPSAGPSPLPLVAESSSGLSVAFSATPTATARVIDVAGSPALEILRGGPVEITASQPGDDRFWPATPVTRSLRLPPLFTSFTANGVELTNGTTLGDLDTLLRVSASDADGIASAEFSLRPEGGAFVPLGTDIIPGDGLTAVFNTESFTPGPHELRVVVSTPGGVTAERLHPVLIELRPPTAPSILTPPSGGQVGTALATLTGRTQRGASVAILRGIAEIAGPVVADPAGNFSVEVPLVPGINTLTARANNAAGDSPQSAPFTIELRSTLELAATPATVTEGEQASLTVRRNHTQGAVTVILRANIAGQVTFPPSVTLVDGQAQAAVTVTAVNDVVPELDSDVILTATATTYASANTRLTLLDNDRPEITLAANRSTIAEGSPPGDLIVMISRQPVTLTPFTILLTTSRPDSLLPPAQVILPGFAPSVEVVVETPDNLLTDGDRTVFLTASILDVTTGEILSESPEIALLVTDDDGPALTLDLRRRSLREGNFTTATLSRNGPTTSPLEVTLSVDDPSEAGVAPSVTIPAGSASVGVRIDALEDGLDDASQPVLLSASADGFSPAQAAFIVTDLDLPDLAVLDVTAPSNPLTEGISQYAYRIENQGTVEITGPVGVRVFLSADSRIDEADEILNTYVYEGGLPPGSYFERTESFFTPRTAGNFRVLVEVDAEGGIAETLETNNVGASPPFQIRAAYSATVSTPVTIAPSGTPIPLSGKAVNLDGSPAAFKLVNLQIRVRETLRTISALTNSNGDFATTFRPLDAEGGVYTVGASHPGVETADPQDSFTLLGFSAGEDSLTITPLRDGTAAIGTLSVTNLADVGIGEVTVSGFDLPAGITITGGQTGVPGLGPLAETRLVFEVTADDSAPAEAAGFLRIESPEGARLDVPLLVLTRENRSRLVSDDEVLDRGMVPGSQSFVNFTVRNEGGLATGPVRILIPPQFPWLTPGSVSPLPSIPPGGEATISLLLNPPADLPPGVHIGTLQLADDHHTFSMPFAIRAISEAKGDLVVRCENEYTYFAASTPPLAGCAITVCDPISGAPLATGTSGTDGVVNFPALREGYYRIKGRAPSHGNFDRTIYVAPGTTTNLVAFLQLQTVRYTWTVVPTEIPDRYRIVIETEFETNVPAPVVTVEPSYIDLDEFTEELSQIDLKITNHGLIAVDNVRVGFGSNENWEIKALASKLGRLPAKSALTVPVTIRRLGDGQRAAGCGVSGSATWEYTCGGGPVGGGAGIGIGGGGTSGGSCGVGGGGSGGSGSIGGGGGGGGVASCDPCILQALIDCGISFIPIPALTCGYAASSTFKDGMPGGLATGDYTDFLQTIVGCVCGFSPYGNACNAANCFIDIIQCIAVSGGGSGAGRSGYAELLELFDERGRAVLAMVEAELAILGDDAWASMLEVEGIQEFFSLYKSTTAGSTDDARRIAETEAAALLASTIGQVNPQLVSQLIARTNRTIDYWAAGWFEIEDVPSGLDTDFIIASSISEASDRVIAAFDQARAAGFDDPVGAFGDVLRDMFTFLSSGGGVCARIKLRLEQEAVMTRDAFDASLAIVNSGTSPLENVEVNVRIIDPNGFDATDRFGIDGPRLTGTTGTAVDGGTTGIWEWTLVPGQDAAPTEAVVYQVVGGFEYIQDGELVRIPLLPQPITVYPNPSLRLKYFHQRDVFSDDPHTDPIEPAIPFSLGVMVENRGAGIAKNLSITSGQPEIVENEKGLFIDFNIIATEVAGQNLSPGLTAAFGDLNPGEIKVGQWLMTSTLQGLFLNYTADFQHLDDLGSERLSLIEDVSIFETIRAVRALGPLDDGLPDFLVNATFDVLDLPDEIHLSNGTVEPVAASRVATTTEPAADQLSVPLTTSGLGAGWGYLRVPDPGDGAFRLVSCVRSDGLAIPLDVNIWTTDRTFIGLGKRPVRENLLHLVDFNSTGSYTLNYQIVEPPDTTPPASQVAALPPASGSFIEVRWSGTDDLAVARYDILVSENGGPFTPWITNTTATAGLFTGDLGSTYGFHSIARDSSGNAESAKSTAEATTTVNLANQPPTLSPAGPLAVNEGATLIFRMTADDPDGPNESLRFSINSPHPAVTIDSRTGRLRWVTTEQDGGTAVEVTVTVTDADPVPLTASQVVRIEVAEVNSPPVLADPGSHVLDVGDALALRLSAQDRDFPAQQIRYRFASGAPAGMTLDPVTGDLSWTPGDADEEKAFEVIVEVYDDHDPAGVASAVLLVEVLKKPGLPPEFDTFQSFVWQTDGVETATITAADPEGEPVTISADVSALIGGWPSFSAVPDQGTATLAWATWGVEPGIYQIPLTASTSRQSTTAVLTIEVVPRAPIPNYPAWVASYGLTPLEGIAERVIHPLGLPNLLVYALGLDPHHGPVPGQPYPGPGTIPPPAEGLRFFIPEGGLGRSDVRYLIQRSDDGMQSWHTIAEKIGHDDWDAPTLLIETTPLEGSLAEVTLRSAEPLPDETVLLRLRVTFENDGLDAFRTWSGGTTKAARSFTGDASHDTNRDGTPDLVAWALGHASPLVMTPAERTSLPALVTTAGSHRFRVEIPPGPQPNVRYLVEVSDDLLTWHPLAVKFGTAPWASETSVAADGSAAWEIALPPGTHRFVRLAVSGHPSP